MAVLSLARRMKPQPCTCYNPPESELSNPLLAYNKLLDDALHAHRYCKSEGVLAGVPFFNAIFAEVGCTVEWSAAEGDHIDPGAGGKSVHSPGPECVHTFVLVHRPCRPSSALLSSHVAAPGNGGDPSDTQFTRCTLAPSLPVVEHADWYIVSFGYCTVLRQARLQLRR